MRAGDDVLAKALTRAAHDHDAFGRSLLVHNIRRSFRFARRAEEYRPLLIPRQHCIHPGDEPGELLHVLPEELLGGLVGDAPIVGDQTAFELHVCLD